MNSYKIIAVVGIALVLLAGIGFYFALNPSAPFIGAIPVQESTSIPPSLPKLEYISPSATPQSEEMPRDCGTYQSNYRFEIQCPNDWEVFSEFDSKNATVNGVPVVFRAAFGPKGPEGDGYDGVFFVFVYNKSFAITEKIVKGMGQQFNDRQEKREHITINGSSATRVVITTPSIPYWYLEEVIIDSQNYIYQIHNGAAKNDLFVKFYESFKLI